MANATSSSVDGELLTSTSVSHSHSDYYGMFRSTEGSARLTLQHFLWRQQFGWSLHPSISASWRTDPPGTQRRIADVACGNGIWSFEIATDPALNSPNPLQLTGFDISPLQYPSPATYPDNVHLELWNFYDPPPDKYLGYFDVLYVRLIFLALRNGNPQPVLENFKKMLKPGGYLQWAETDMGQLPHAPDLTLIHEFSPKMFALYGVKGTHDNAWMIRLPEIIAEAGLTGVVCVRAPPRSEFGRFWWDNWCQGQREMVKLLNNKELEELFVRACAEVDERGQYPLWSNQVVVAKKI